MLDFPPVRGEFAAGIDAEARVAGRQFQVHDLAPNEVLEGVRAGRYLLVDVREPNEVAFESYPEAVAIALSMCDARAIPDPHGRDVVFACRSGKRSVTASLIAQEQGLAYDKHLAGGMLAWKRAGCPTRNGGG